MLCSKQDIFFPSVIPSEGEPLSMVEHMANPNRSRGTLPAQEPCIKCVGRCVNPKRFLAFRTNNKRVSLSVLHNVITLFKRFV
jgi:hypothetical protein